MADSTLDSSLLMLAPGMWGGATVPYPRDGILGSTHNVAAIPDGLFLGAVCGIAGASATKGFAGGYTTFLYAQIDITGTPTVAVKQFCVPDANTNFYTLTNDPAANVDIETLPCAVALSAMASDGYYGWFWCGGPCPSDIVVALDTNLATKNDVAIGLVMASPIEADAIGIAARASTNYGCGWSLSNDA